MKRALFFMAGLAGALHGQTTINGDRRILGQWDASAATGTIPFQVGTMANLPTSCATGQMYFATDGGTGRKLHSCTGASTWEAVGYGQGTTPGMPATCAIGELYFATDTAAVRTCSRAARRMYGRRSPAAVAAGQ